MEYRKLVTYSLLCVLLFGATSIVLQNRPEPDRVPLHYFIPQHALSAFIVERDFIRSDPHPLIAGSPGAHDFLLAIRTEWEHAEGVLQRPIGQALWYVTASSSEPVVIARLSQSLTKKQQRALHAVRIEGARLTPQASVSFIDDRTVALTADPASLRIHSDPPIFGDTPFAVYVSAESASMFQDLFREISGEDIVPTFSLGLDRVGNLLRARFSYASEAPASYDPRTALISRIAERYSIAADLVAPYVFDSTLLVVQDDGWLLAGETAVLRSFAGALTAWVNPRIRVSTLPDGSPYRQYLKQQREPELEIWNGAKRLVWRATTTSGEAKPLLYGYERSAEAIITDSDELFSQYAGKAAPFMEDQAVAGCQKGLESVIMEYSAMVSRKYHIIPGIETFTALYQPADSNGKRSVILCLE